MHHSVWLIGVLMCLGGVAMVLKPDWMKKVMVFFSVRHRFQAAAVVKLAFGILFLIFARDCRLWQVIVVFGFLIAGGNLWALAAKPKTTQSFMLWWQKQPFWVYRLWGILGAVFGSIIIYAGIPA